MLNNHMYNKRVLITGACGTIGAELFHTLIENEAYRPAEVVGIDNRESELFMMEQKYLDVDYAHFFLADIRDMSKISRVMRGIDIVFHTAAFKHVILCERGPFEAVQTNIHGVQNVILAAVENQVERVVFTSSDKAVNPTNVMGTSKLMGERLITAANNNYFSKKTILASTRFGNVMGSSGSVVPIFQKQIMNGGPVTLTKREMTRFIMSIQSAAALVINSAGIMQGGEVFITKMPAIRIEDLARVMVDELAPLYGFDPQQIEVSEIGAKPGEKLYEELMSQEETRRAVELEDYFVVIPAFRGVYDAIPYTYSGVVSTDVDNPYISVDEPPMTREELRAFLVSNQLLDLTPCAAYHPARRYWPGDKKES